MSDRLDKARAALKAAKEVLDTADQDHNGNLPLQDAENVQRLMHAAGVNAQIAQAEAIERLADVFERRFIALARSTP